MTTVLSSAKNTMNAVPVRYVRERFGLIQRLLSLDGPAAALGE